MSFPKKRKTYYFHDEWEMDYFFIMVKEKCRCLICNTSVALSKKANVKRHYNTMHGHEYDADFPPKSEIRKQKLDELKSKLISQQQLMLQNINTTIASFKISNLIAKKNKSFTEGEFVKDCFVESAKKLFKGFKNKKEIIGAFQDLQLSRTTVVWQIEKMAGDITEQLLEDISNCVAFSLQMDESTDIDQLLVFIRMVFEDFSVREEFLGMISLKGRTTTNEIFNYFHSLLSKYSLPLHRLVSMSTDGTKPMACEDNGLLALCRQHEDFPDFFSYHCIIHQQVLASKRLNTKTVMAIAFKIANSAHGKALQRRLFNLALDEGAAEMILHTDVRWLSRHKFLQTFRNLLDEIRSFLKESGDYTPELDEEEWLCDLAFLADFTGELSNMNLEIQGKNKSVIDMMSTFSSYQSRFELLMTDLGSNIFDHFSNVQDHLGQYPNFIFQNEKYVTEICSVLQEFEKRFCDFKKIEPVVVYLSYPFKVELDIKNIAAAISENFLLDKPSVENEILTLKNDIFLKARAEQESFWKFVPRDKFPNLRRCSEAVHSCFGSTYLCESAFSNMKLTMNSQRTTITEQNLQDSLRLAITEYSPNFKKQGKMASQRLPSLHLSSMPALRKEEQMEVAIEHPCLAGGTNETKPVLPQDAFLTEGSSTPPLISPSGSTSSAMEMQSVHSHDGMAYGEEAVYCRICLKAGAVVMCDGCKQCYHLDCHLPPLRYIPGHDWKCLLCEDVTPVFIDGEPKTLSVADQKRCERVLFELLCFEPCRPLHRLSNATEGQNTIDLTLIRAKLQRKLSPPYTSPDEFVDDLWKMIRQFSTLTEDKEDVQSIIILQRFFEAKLSAAFGDRKFAALYEPFNMGEASSLWLPAYSFD